METQEKTLTPAQQRAQNKAEKLSITNVATLDIKNPIPFEPSGESDAFHFATRKNKRYIPFLAPKDNFFQILLEAKLLSPTNNSCINSKADFCTGKGLVHLEEKEDSTFKEFIDWAKRVNKKGQSLNVISKSTFNNHFTFGNGFLEIVRVKVGSSRGLRVYLHSVLDCRLADPTDEDDDIPKTVFISKRFRRKNAWSLVDDLVVELPIYYGDENMQWYVSDEGTEHCVIHLKNETPGYEYYGMPSNCASLPQQILEYKGARANLDDLDNNMVIGGVVVLEGNVTQEEANKVGREIIHTHTGDGKRGRWTVVSGAKGITGSKIQSYDTKKDGSFLKMDENCESKIIDSNNWDSSLYGQHKSSGMGNGGFAYLSAVFDTKNETVIKPMQEWIMENFIKVVLKMHDEWVGTKWADLQIGFKTVSPVSFSGEIDVNKILTVDEGRAILGQPAMEDQAVGKQIIDNGKSKDKVNVPDKQIK